MKISTFYPPNWPQIELYKNSGKFNSPKGSVYAYDGVVYNPDNAFIDVPTYVHECIHLDQQKKFGSADDWWTKYLRDKKFRFSQELPAYQAQYHEVKNWVKDKGRLGIILNTFADEVVSLFSGLVSKKEAKRAIESGKLVEVKIIRDETVGKDVPNLLTDTQFKKDVEESLKKKN